jgi:hypothetical protein
MKTIFALVCALPWIGTAQAGLFIPKDTRMAMGMYSPDSSMLELSYGFTRDWSGAAGWHHYESDDGEIERDFYAVRATYLALRSYYSDAIANVYVYGGPAWAESDEFDDGRLGAQMGFWADYETRRVYTRASLTTHWTSEFSQTVLTTQALWAPYAADYEDIASWIGVQLERRNGLNDDATQVTPMLRFFQRNWWVDGGVSVNSAHRGDVFINVMILY